MKKEVSKPKIEAKNVEKKTTTFKVHDLDSGWSSFEITSAELAFSVLRAYRKKTMNSGGYHRKVVIDSEGHTWLDVREYVRY